MIRRFSCQTKENLKLRGFDVSQNTENMDQSQTDLELKPEIDSNNSTLVSFSGKHGTADFPNISGNTGNDFQHLDEEISMLIEKVEQKGYACKMCGLEMSSKQHMQNHVEGKHIRGLFHPCSKCEDGRSFQSRHTLKVHMSKFHRRQSDYLKNIKREIYQSKKITKLLNYLANRKGGRRRICVQGLWVRDDYKTALAKPCGGQTY